MSDFVLTRNEQHLQDQITSLQHRRFPAGFYTLGVELVDKDFVFDHKNNIMYHIPETVKRRFSHQSLVMILPGEERVFRFVPNNLSKCFSVHSWGLCRLKSVKLGNSEFILSEGALFVDVDKCISPGQVLDITVQALDFEPLSEMK
jgi:hypothetical protein